MTRPKKIPQLIRKLLPLLRTVVSRGLGAVSQLLLAWVVARGLTKDETGEFLFYLTCFTILSPLTLLGTFQYAMRELSRFESITDEARSVATDLVTLHSRALLIATTVLLSIGWLVDRGLGDSATYGFFAGNALRLAIGSLTAAIAVAVSGHLHGLRRLASSIFFSHIGVPAITVGLVLVFRPSTADQVISCHLVACLVMAMLAVASWCWIIAPNRVPPLSPLVRKIPRESFDFWSLNACQLVMNWSPLVIAGYFLATAEIAEVNLAQRAGNLINFLLIVVSFTFAPTFRFHHSQGDMAGLRHTVNQCSRYLIGLGSILFAAVIVGAPLIMSSFGNHYRGSATILCIYALGQYFNVITGSVNQLLTMCDHERVLRNICWGSATCSSCLALSLTPWLGPVGVALATSMALIFQNVLAVMAVRRLLGFWVFDIRTQFGTSAA
ncbi:MAG: polysaccharide biosynthesis C-terminal domain-containing protein [Planctomycetota bacterium]